MKKFFKKISLVLAFALVLGSADHATVAKAADTWKFQSAAETLYLGSQTVGADTFDFNFSNAPAGYTTSNRFDWSSSDTKVATVAAGGIVTAKADGKTTITCRVTNKTTGLLTATASAIVTVRTITHATKVEIYDAKDSLKTPITSAKLVVGETIDLNRQLTNAAGVVSAAGQATNTASTDKTAFKTSDEKVATVDPSTGVVTAVKAGTATVTAYTYDVTDATKTPIKTATVTVTVVADASYTAKQTAVDAFTITFENDVTFDASKLQVYKIFEQDGIKEEINTYVKTTKQTGKDVKVTLYFEFDAEATDYKVVYDGIEQHFVAEIGKAVNIVVKSVLNDDEVYIYNSDIAASVSTDIIVYPVDANGIDVSNQYADLSYNLETVDELSSIGEAENASNTASIAVSEEAADGQTVVVTGSFVVSAEDDDVIEFTKVFYAKKAPTQRIISLAGAYIDTNGLPNTAEYDPKWSNTSLLSIALNDEGAEDSGTGNVEDPRYLHVKLKDNYGNFAYSGDTDNGTISFASANPDKLLIDADSNEVKTIATGSAIPVVVYWTSPATSSAQRAKAVAIVPVTITLKRTVTKVTSKVGTPTIANTSVDVVTGANTTTVTLTILDNYDAKIDPTSVVAYTKDKTCSLSSETPREFVKSSKGVWTTTLDSDMFNLPVGTNAKTYNFTVVVDGKTYSSAAFSVKVADPTKGTEGVLVTATEADITVNKDTQSGKLFTEGDAENTAHSTIEVFKTRNGVKLSTVANVFPYITNQIAAQKLNTISSSVSTYDVYFYDVVLGGNVISEKSNATDGLTVDKTFCVAATGTNVNGAYVRDTLAAGNYTVRLYRAGSKTKDSTTVSKLSGSGTTATLVVKDASGVLSIESTGVDLTTDETVPAVKELFNFKYTDKANSIVKTLNNDDDAQFAVVAKTVGEYVYVESVTVTYKPSASGAVEAVQKTFNINKTFPVQKTEN